MTEKEWLQCADPSRMLAFLRRKPSERKLRLFAVACCRRIEHLLVDERSRTAVEVAERHADGFADAQELTAAQAQARAANRAMGRLSRKHSATDVGAGWAAWSDCAGAYAALQVTVRAGVAEVARSAAEAVQAAAGLAAVSVGKREPKVTAAGNAAQAQERLAIAGLLRCVFPSPFRPVASCPSWITTTVHNLAEAVYEERTFDRMPILADALEDAGCDNADILQLCRSGGEHVRGCWVVDLLLGKK